MFLMVKMTPLNVVSRSVAGYQNVSAAINEDLTILDRSSAYQSEASHGFLLSLQAIAIVVH
jgi:hypothetical protein